MKTKNSRVAVSIPKGLGISLLVNIMTTGVITLVVSIMVNQRTIKWENIGYWIIVMLLLSSFLGTKAAICSIKTQRYLIALMSGTIYWILLMCITALFFGGKFSSVLETMSLIAAGSITAALLRKSKTNMITKKKRIGSC